MLSTADREKMQSAVDSAIGLLGVPATWTQAAAPYTSKSDIVVGFRTIGFKDEELINAFGIGAKVLTVRVSDIESIEKFDRFTIGDQTYTIDAVMPVYLNGVHILHKCFVKGK